MEELSIVKITKWYLLVSKNSFFTHHGKMFLSYDLPYVNMFYKIFSYTKELSIIKIKK